MTTHSVFTLPPGCAFLDSLAAGILDRVGDDPLALSAVTVLLPTRRACRALRDTFLRLSNGRPMLLPRMRPLGDLDADELTIAAGDVAEMAPGAGADIPPAIGGLTRQMLLARLILQATGLSATTPQAVRLAGELGRLLDQVQTERLDFGALAALVPEDFAEHWQLTLDFLKIVTEHWPRIVADQGFLDVAERRNRVLDTQATVWRDQSPTDLVIAAGSTGSIPATRALLAVIATLPNGLVLLPGLDRSLDDNAWNQLEESHPQANLARLLATLGVTRQDVLPWRPVVAPAPAERSVLLSEALRPAAATDAWRALPAIDPGAVQTLRRIDCPDAQTEAAVIALLLRQTLLIPERTAMLVTPDRCLARRVASLMTRWGVTINDSAGTPLSDTAVGSFLRLTAECAGSNFAPVALLSVLKHPLSGGGFSKGRCRALTRLLERSVLRGPAPVPGLAGFRAALEAASELGTRDRRTLVDWLATLEPDMQPLADLMPDHVPLSDLLRAHLRAAEALAATDTDHGPDQLWQHDDGEAAATFVAELDQAARGFPPLAGSEYPALLTSLLALRRVRPRYGLSPRLSILGPLEARLLHADLVIVGGLNEGTWPAEPAADPWMSRPMRAAFGLPAPERQIALAAHDFAQLAATPEVYLTRAERVAGAPTVPSRWLVRLDTVLQAAGLAGSIEAETATWVAWAKALDRPRVVRPVPPPQPRPPVAVRPRRLSVTQVETWMRDPYAIYARNILRLRKLNPIASDPGAAERGQFIHQALDDFVGAYPTALPTTALADLLAMGRRAFGPALARPEVWAFWWPRFERIATWFLEFEHRRRSAGATPLATEIRGELGLPGPAGDFTLIAKADRIDRLTDGSLAIIDYKTGLPPSDKQVRFGFAPQLPLEGLMAQAGAFSGVPAGTVAALAFWRLNGANPPGEEKSVKDPTADLIADAHAGLLRLVAAFDDPATPYRSTPRPAHAPRFTDYAHLARIQEWSAAGDVSDY